MATGFTDKLGQCGFCMKQYKSFALLRRHRNKYHKQGVEKNKANEKQLPKPDSKHSKRKGVSMTTYFTLSFVQFDMGLMRKMRDEGKFKNSMLAEIERDELLAKMTQQVDEIQDDLEVRTPTDKVARLIILFRKKSLTFLKRPSVKTYP